MTQQRPWQFDEGELPEWAQGAARPRDQGAQTWPVVAAPRSHVPLPVLGRLFLWRVVSAATFFALLLLGRSWAAEGNILQAVAIGALVGFALGAYFFVQALVQTAEAASLQQQGAAVPPLSVRVLVPFLLLPLLGALIVMLAVAVQYLFSNRVLGLVILIPACIALHRRLGPAMLRFSRDHLLAGYLVDRELREHYRHVQLAPDLVPLAVCLAIALIVPALLSVSLAIAVMVAYLAAHLTGRFRTLSGYGTWRAVGGGIQARARHTVFDFCDYRPAAETHWRPRLGRRARWASMILLTTALDLILVVALAGFFPWELFASLAVPGYEFPRSALTHYPAADFQWFLTPIELAGKAPTLLLYLFGIVVALPLLILVPPAVLLSMYLPSLVELEKISQETKRSTH